MTICPDGTYLNVDFNVCNSTLVGVTAIVTVIVIVVLSAFIPPEEY